MKQNTIARELREEAKEERLQEAQAAYAELREEERQQLQAEQEED